MQIVIGRLNPKTSMYDTQDSHSPRNQKRHREEEPPSTKRYQKLQIFSQEHIRTVSMMMEALRQQRVVSSMEGQELELALEIEPETCPQKAFWPDINRIKT